MVGENNHSFAALRAIKQCVIAVTALELASKVVKVGNCSGRDVQKFQRFGLRALPASLVAAPLMADCFANPECKVIDTRFVNRFNLFMLEVRPLCRGWPDDQAELEKAMSRYFTVLCQTLPCGWIQPCLWNRLEPDR